MAFHKMQELPARATDLKGNIEEFSVSVLVYDKDEPTWCEKGYYNFDFETWSHFGDASMKLICWSDIPDATDFVESNNLEFVLHDGYID